MDGNTWLPVATLMLGAGLGYLADWHRERRAESRERRAQRVAFQRQAIMDAQDAAWTSYRGAVYYLHLCREFERTSGRWPVPDDPVFDWEEEERRATASIRMQMLGTRVADPDLSADVERIRQTEVASLAAASAEHGERRRRDLVTELDRLDKRTRVLLAELF